METKQLLANKKFNNKLKNILYRYLRWKNITQPDINDFVDKNSDVKDSKFFKNMREKFKLKKNVENKKYWGFKAKKHRRNTIKWVKGKEYLDFGGGDGYMAEFYGEGLFKNIYVHDISEWAGQKRKPNPNITFIDDIKKIKTDSVDVVSAWHVLHHVSNIKTQLSQIKRVLKPNGRLIIYEHDVRNDMQYKFIEFQHRIFTMGMDAMNLKKHKETYSKYRSKKEWEKLIGLKVLKVINIKSSDYSYYMVFKNQSI